jgi:hypothetical protein
VTDVLVIFEFDDCLAESANHTKNSVVWQFACDDVCLITLCQNQKLAGNKPAQGQVHFPGYELNFNTPGHLRICHILQAIMPHNESPGFNREICK